MKVVILAGGYGTRISELSCRMPKPLVNIGEMPIIWHIMKIYSTYGFKEFVICAGYKQHLLKEFFYDYFKHNADVTFDNLQCQNQLTLHNNKAEEWKVTLVDTGLETMTGGRVKRIKEYLDQEPFLLTYGDGLADIDIQALVDYHKQQGKMVTLSAYGIKQRFGVLELADNGCVKQFREKQEQDRQLINIGFMVCEPQFLDLIEDDNTVLEKEPLEQAVQLGQLMAYVHKGFWKCMDSLKEKEELDKLWNEGRAPWKVW